MGSPQPDKSLDAKCESLDEFKNLNAMEVVSSVSQETWHSWNYMGGLQDVGSSELGNIRIGVMDVGTTVNVHNRGSDDELHSLKVTDYKIMVNCGKCEKEGIYKWRMHEHGIHCASILAGQPHFADFFGISSGDIRGALGSAKLYLYVIACKHGVRNRDFDQAIDEAIKDKIDVLSVSITRNRQPPSFLRDVFASSFLKAFKAGIIVCSPAGNNGPHFMTLKCESPWVLTVGACMAKMVFKSTIEIGVATGDNIQVIERLQGISCNIKGDDKFYPLGFWRLPKDEELFIAYEDDGYKARVASVDEKNSALSKVNFEKGTVWLDLTRSKYLMELREKHKRLDIKVLKSDFCDDPNYDHVAEFSSRGPARIGKGILKPNIVAPGYGILASTPKDIPLSEGHPSSEHSVFTGSSAACPHVAGLAALLKSRNHGWSPSAILSAITTTATRIDDEPFASGAGLPSLQKAGDPGLILEENYASYESYCEGNKRGDELNLPFFVREIDFRNEQQTFVFHRELTCVHGSSIYKCNWKEYENSIAEEYSFEMKPNILSFDGENRTQQFRLEVTFKAKHPGGRIFASVEWTDGDHIVTAPVLVYDKIRYLTGASTSSGECGKRKR